MCAGELALAVEVPPAFDEHLGLPLLANHFRIGGSLSDSPLELLTILNGEFIAHSVKAVSGATGSQCPAFVGGNGGSPVVVAPRAQSTNSLS